MMLRFLLAAVLALCAPASALAAKRHGHVHARSSAARLRSEMPAVPLPSPMPTIVRGPCPGIGENDMTEGCADDATNTIYIGRSVDRFGVQHELGHIFDAQYLDATERQRFAELVGESRIAWESTTVTPDGYLVTSDDAVEELFADAYAACRLRLLPQLQGHAWEVVYGYDPAPQRHVRVCQMIAAAAKTPGTPLDANGWR